MVWDMAQLAFLGTLEEIGKSSHPRCGYSAMAPVHGIPDDIVNPACDREGRNIGAGRIICFNQATSDGFDGEGRRILVSAPPISNTRP